MRKMLFLFVSLAMCSATVAQRKQQLSPSLSDRQIWLAHLDKMVRPVLSSLAHDSLKLVMPKVVSQRSDNPANRTNVMYVEVLGRVLSGIAPWLQLEGGSPDEVKLRNQYREWALQGLGHALDSASKDFMRFDVGAEPFRATGELHHMADIFLGALRVNEQRRGGNLRCVQDLIPGFVHQTPAFNSKIASISTAMFPGSDPIPTAERAPIPFSFPNTSANNSLQPLITCG